MSDVNACDKLFSPKAGGRVPHTAARPITPAACLHDRENGPGAVRILTILERPEAWDPRLPDARLWDKQKKTRLQEND